MSQRAELEKTRPGDPFPCPKCGASDWVAHYKVPETQGIVLQIGEGGTPVEIEYDGCTKSYDADANEFYACGECDSLMTLDGKPTTWGKV